MNRLTMMGELAASLAHEIAQPIATRATTPGGHCAFWTETRRIWAKSREALACIVDDADRAGDIIDRIRDHIKKAPPRKGRFDLNKAIDEVIHWRKAQSPRMGSRSELTLRRRYFPSKGIVFNCNRSC